MLTKEAFNALLKTLEEPPPRVKFVFCTTEPNKVPDTILSRCQRFDFSTVETANIAQRLTQIAEAEGISVSAEATELIARRAAGSMRDSQSLFDQLLAFGGDEIGADDVHRLMGTAPDDLLHQIVQAMVNGGRDELLHIVDSALASGVRLGELVDQLINYFRDLMVLAAGAENVSLIGVAGDQRSALQSQASSFGIETIVAALQLLAETRARMQRVTFSRSLAELAFIRIALLENLDQLGPLMQALKSGEPLSLVTTNSTTTTETAPSPTPPSSDTDSLSESQNTPAQSAPAAPLAEEKKNPPEDNSTEEIGVDAAPAVKFIEGKEKELLTELISKSEDRVNQHLKGVVDSAISAPNRLDLLFPSSYSFSKNYCEEPEIRHQLEHILRDITGQTVHLAFRIVESEETHKQRSITQPTRPKRHPREHCDDPFVSQAMSIFQAKIIDVRQVANPAETDEQE